MRTDVRTPASSRELDPWPDLSDSHIRAEMSSAAVRALPNLQDRWGLTVTDMCGLLGDVSPSTWHKWQTTPPKDLGPDRLTRVSLLLGIYTALHSIHQNDIADQWPTLPNSNPIFGGRKPVIAMIAGGIPTMIETRKLLDGRRGGM